MLLWMRLTSARSVPIPTIILQYPGPRRIPFAWATSADKSLSTIAREGNFDTGRSLSRGGASLADLFLQRNVETSTLRLRISSELFALLTLAKSRPAPFLRRCNPSPRLRAQHSLGSSRRRSRCRRGRCAGLLLRSASSPSHHRSNLSDLFVQFLSLCFQAL